jgi:hypothetical protein
VPQSVSIEELHDDGILIEATSGLPGMTFSDSLGP